MLVMPRATGALECERLWLNISATLIFLSFHAGSHLTIGVASGTWSTSAVVLDLKRKLATKSCIACFWTQIGVQQRGNARFHRRSNSLRLPALSDPAACRVFFFVRAGCPLVLLVLVARRRSFDAIVFAFTFGTWVSDCVASAGLSALFWSNVDIDRYKLGERRTLLRDFSASVTSSLAMSRGSLSGRGQGKQSHFCKLCECKFLKVLRRPHNPKPLSRC